MGTVPVGTVPVCYSFEQVADLDPHYFGKSDPEPDLHRNGKLDPDRN